MGTTVGQYRIVGTIGVGGMGVVYSAEHLLLGRSAAVKVLLPEVSSNQEMVGRFFNEARAAAAIQHPGIVEIYDVGTDTDGSAYIVMEHLRGESLAQRLARGRMAPATIAIIARQVASALAAAHHQGIVHRDLKPDNIFLVPDEDVIGGERIKLLDFGIAKLSRGGEPLKTRTGVIMGTPTYMAPEQCRGRAVDHRADLYALGCILFEMCTGQPPFTGAGDGEMLAAHIHVPPPTVSSVVADIPAEMETMIGRLLVKEREQRTQSAEQLVHAARAMLCSTFRSDKLVQTLAQPHNHTTLSASASMLRPRSFVRHRGAWLTGIALVAASAIATGAISWTTASSTAEPSPASAALIAQVQTSTTTAGNHRSAPPSDLVVEPSQFDTGQQRPVGIASAPPSDIVVQVVQPPQFDTGQQQPMGTPSAPPSNIVLPPPQLDVGQHKGRPGVPPSGLVLQPPKLDGGLHPSMPGISPPSLTALRTAGPAEPRPPSARSRPSLASRGAPQPLQDEAARNDTQATPSTPPAEAITADGLAAQYAAVGRQLKAFDQDRGSGATSDLWPRYLSIRINDAIANPDKRAGVSYLLLQLRDQILERSR